MTRWLALSAGGLAGTFARYGVSSLAPAGASLPYGTFAVNLSACALIGLFDGWATARAALSPEARLMLVTGFCGAYSTFSTLILETAALADAGRTAAALAYYLASGVLGLALFRAGAALGAAF